MMENVSKIKGYCNGCSSCAVACPKQAISISKTDFGFFESFVDSNKCVNCGICSTICKKTQKNFTNPSISKALALQSKDNNILRESSSGGVAFEISRFLLEKKYKVVGSFFNSEKNGVETKVGTNLDDINSFRKSKYLQSNFYNGLKETIELAKKDKKNKFVVFGTPCQINGVANICDFYKIKDQFILIDFFCHGVPSYNVWDCYLKDNKIDCKCFNNVSFRSKEKGGWHSSFKIRFHNEKKSFPTHNPNDDFYKAFFDNVFFMKSCYQCDFRKGFSRADVRLGDYWGKKFSKNNDGVSAAFIYTEKGNALLKDIDLKILDIVNPNDILEAQSTGNYSEEFLNDFALETLIKENSLRKAIKIYRKKFGFKKRLKLKVKSVVKKIFPSSFVNFLKRF